MIDPPPMVCVEWQDSGENDSIGWANVEDYISSYGGIEDCLALTVGFMMYEDDDVIMVGQSYDAKNDMYFSAQTILKKCIIRQHGLFAILELPLRP